MPMRHQQTGNLPRIQIIQPEGRVTAEHFRDIGFNEVAQIVEHRARDAGALLVIWIDEAQRFVTTSKNHGEASVVDLVREANCAVVLATQSITSLVAVLGRETAKVLALNLRNRMGFRSADQEDAEEVAGRLGKRKKSKVSFSYGRGGRQRNVAGAEWWFGSSSYGGGIL